MAERAKLYDWRGRPVELGALDEEIVTARAGGVQTLFNEHPDRGLTPRRLARLFLEAEDGRPSSLFELAKEIEKKDTNIRHCLRTRRNGVINSDWTVTAASDGARDREIAEGVERMLALPEVRSGLRDSLDAIFKGLSVLEILWDAGAPRLKYCDPRHFEFDRFGDEPDVLKLRRGATLEDLPPFRFVVHFHGEIAAHPVEAGLVWPLAWMYLFKNFGLKDWLEFLEVYGMPIRVGKYPPNASEAERKALWSALLSLARNAAGMFPDGMGVDFPKGAEADNDQAFKRLCEYVDAQVQIVILGQTLTTQTGEYGSRSLGEVHNEVRKDIADGDDQDFADTWNRDLIRPWVDLNYGPQEAYPALTIKVPRRAESKDRLDVVRGLVEMGAPIAVEDVLGEFGLRRAEEGQDTLRPGAAAAPPAIEPNARRALPMSRDGGGTILDDLTDDVLDEWRELLGPVAEPVLRAIEGAESYEEAHRALFRALVQTNAFGVIDRLHQDLFIAETAGRVGAPLPKFR